MSITIRVFKSCGNWSKHHYRIWRVSCVMENAPGDLATQTVFLDSVVTFLRSHANCTVSAKDMELKYIVDEDLKKRLLL